MTKRSKKKIDTFYVVTRAGRRVEPKNYWTFNEATKNANKLKAVLRKWNDADATRVEIIKTHDPSSIY